MLLVSDRALLDGFRAGRPEALQAVYRHYAPRVHGHLRAGFSFSSGGRRLRFHGYQRPYDLENAVQEVFLRAFVPRARLSYDGLRPYGDYLLAIARNLVLNELRRKEALFVDEERADEAEQPPVEELYEQRELDGLLASFAAGLDARMGDYYRARFVENRSQVEAAAALGMHRIVARRLEAKLKLALLDHMKAHGYLEDVPSAIVGSLVLAKR
jgi:RNA polymerase sigma-70 factor (ECF subfamily)